jgi:hypothetical protein
MRKRLKDVEGKRQTKVASIPRSVVTPTCSLSCKSARSGQAIDFDALCHGQQIVAVNALIVDLFIILAYSAGVNHVVARLVNFGIE